MQRKVLGFSFHALPFYASKKKTTSGGIKWLPVLCFFLSAAIFLCPWPHIDAKEDNPEKIVSGIVSDDKGPISGAVVRIQTTEHSTVTDANGEFRLSVPEGSNKLFKLTAWARGYYISGPVEASSGEKQVTISLHRHSKWDNLGYKWLPSSRSTGSGENQGCAECHFRGDTASGPMLPVDEWLRDAHSQSAVNPIFLTLHTGTDVSGRRSESTHYRYTEDLRLIPLPPDPGKPYYGPGYRLDFPNTAGNCGACHTPAAAINVPLNTYPDFIGGVGAEGVNCDFCHKIWDAHLDPATGLPSPDKPGVLSYEFRRPFDGHQFFAGPLDDIAPGEDTYSGLQKNSQFCAPCHFGVFEGTVIYDSFGEWLRSPYSRKDTGKTCQDCHMPSSGADYFAHPEKGGLKRNPDTLVSHKMPGARDIKLLQNSVSFFLEADPSPGGIRVKTKITNDATGHHVPTDSPLRHLILVVRAFDSNGAELELKEGPVLPEWCGSGDPAEGCYADLPGKVFVKLLEEKWTGVSPTAAYWNPTKVVMDTRIPAFGTDIGEFLFDSPESGEVQVEAVLIYRRAFKKLLEQKGITEPDIVMESAEISVPEK